MSLVEFLFGSRTRMELAKELAQTAKEKAHLLDKIHELEHNLFWSKSRDTHTVRLGCHIMQTMLDRAALVRGDYPGPTPIPPDRYLEIDLCHTNAAKFIKEHTDARSGLLQNHD